VNDIIHEKRTPLFMMGREINVISIYEPFSFAQIIIIETQEILVVDIGCISEKPDYTKSVSLKLFGGTT
jgi:hypothetical protein